MSNYLRIKGYCINLQERTDRRKSFEESVKKCWPQLDYQIFPAIRGGGSISNRLACRQSHHAAITKYRRSSDFGNYDAVLICEDDCVFVEPCHDKTHKQLLPSYYQMLFLSFRPLEVNKTANPNWFRIKNGWSMLCYLIPNHFVDTYLSKTAMAVNHFNKKGDPSNGFEHIWNIPRSMGGSSKFITDYHCLLPLKLWATLSTDPKIGASNIAKSTITSAEIIKRINWSDHYNVIMIEKHSTHVPVLNKSNKLKIIFKK